MSDEKPASYDSLLEALAVLVEITHEDEEPHPQFAEKLTLPRAEERPP